MNDHNYLDSQAGPAFIYEQQMDSLELKKARKRMQNRESAVRSRMKKKVQQESIEHEVQHVQVENNKLKLENATLRAENQLLKR